MQSFTSPERAAANPLAKVWTDVHYQRTARRRAPYPPGPTGIGPTFTFLRDPLGVLLPAYDRFGPVFTMRSMHALMIWAIGPQSQHQVLVSEAGKFHWREGLYRELIPLLGDGLISTDDEYHDRSRRLMLPVFHTERLAAATLTMVQETDRAVDALRPGHEVDAYEWARAVAIRVAMRALFGLDPDRNDATHTAREFERGLSFYSNPPPLWLLRGPGAPYSRLRAAREQISRVVFREIERRRREGSEGENILSLLMNAQDDDGWRFADTQLLDHSLTLLFAGHDTTTTTVALALYELARHPEWRDRLATELDSELSSTPATEEQLFAGLPVLEQVLDETLRLYPPVPASLRRAIEDVELAGVRIPAGAIVNLCPWAGHRLAEVFPDPHQFRPERMTREQKARLPKGAYIPFGGGRRICIGKRFGYLEAKVILSRLLQRYVPQLQTRGPVHVKWAATLVPDGGVPIRMIAR